LASNSRARLPAPHMIPSLRQAFNSKYKAEKYPELLALLAERCGVPIGFRVSETPCFLPPELLQRMADDGKTLIRQLVDSPEYRARSAESIPPEFNVPRESPHPMFVQVDFGLVRDAAGVLQHKLVELQAFPSLYTYQPVLARTFIDVFGLDESLRYLLSGLDSVSYLELFRRAIIGAQDPENVILMEIDPLQQKTLPDFLLTEKLLGIRTVDITQIKKEGARLYWEDAGKRVPIKRIYNRAIVDELERKGAKLSFDFRDDLDVEWAGHPNWYFRISKYSIPYLKHPSVPKTWFLDRLERVPDDLDNYALKPLYSFAGLGVLIAPKRADIAAVPAERRSQYILQERLHFEPVIATPFGGTKVEVRVMYVWVDELTPVLTILRMGRGLMMGVDHNRNMEWVGSSAGLYLA
jgi:hypothetical protein